MMIQAYTLIKYCRIWKWDWWDNNMMHYWSNNSLFVVVHNLSYNIILWLIYKSPYFLFLMAPSQHTAIYVITENWCRFFKRLEVRGANAPLLLAPAEGFEDSWPQNLTFIHFSFMFENMFEIIVCWCVWGHQTKSNIQWLWW